MLLGLFALTACGQQAEAPAKKGQPVHLVETAAVVSDNLNVVRTRTGSLRALREVKVFAQEEGLVTALPFYESDRVSKGDVIVRLDDTLLRTQLARATATRKQAQQDLQRQEGLRERKLASEDACRVYHHLYGLETVCLRYFNVFGPRQDPSSPYSGVISIFSDSLKHGKQPNIYGDGEQTRDFVYVSDVVEANIKAATAPSAAGKAINIATGGKLSINALLKTICDLKGQPFEPQYKPGRQGDIKHSRADISAASEFLDWEPVVAFEDGLRKLFES